MSRPPGRAPVVSTLLLAALAATIAAPTFADLDQDAAEDQDVATRQPLNVAVELKERTFVPYDRHEGTGHVLLARRDDVEMRIDGRLDEGAWQGLEVHEDFRLIDPDTLEPGSLPTRVRMFYTERGFYLGVDMVQDPETLVEHLSGRDQGMLNRDYFSFTLDTSGEGRYGFWFQLCLGNSVADGTILPERNYSTSWDGAWRAARRAPRKAGAPSTSSRGRW